MPLNDEYEIQLSVPEQQEELMRLCRECWDREYDLFVKGRMQTHEGVPIIFSDWQDVVCFDEQWQTMSLGYSEDLRSAARFRVQQVVQLRGTGTFRFIRRPYYYHLATSDPSASAGLHIPGLGIPKEVATVCKPHGGTVGCSFTQEGAALRWVQSQYPQACLLANEKEFWYLVLARCHRYVNAPRYPPGR